MSEAYIRRLERAVSHAEAVVCSMGGGDLKEPHMKALVEALDALNDDPVFEHLKAKGYR